MKEITRVLVVDDHPLFANATRSLLEEMEGIEVIGVVSLARQCLEQVALHQPDLVFLDYNLPDQIGTDVAAQLKRLYPSIHIVIFTGIDLTDILNNVIDLRISGVLSKESNERTIRNMVNCILDGYTMLSLPLFHQVQLNNEPPQEEPVHVLEDEEIRIMNLLVKGSTHEHIAERIHMSKRTVDNYLRKIYAKLGASSKTTAMEKFIRSKYYS